MSDANGAVTIESDAGEHRLAVLYGHRDALRHRRRRASGRRGRVLHLSPEAPITDLSGFTPNLEAIVGYEPDLVVISFDPGELVSGLEAVGVPTLLSPDRAEPRRFIHPDWRFSGGDRACRRGGGGGRSDAGGHR